MLKAEGASEISSGNEAIRHLKQAIAEGKHWYLALLEAVGLWTEAEETIDGYRHCYLVGGEAFDWLALAERLCQELGGLVSQEEMADLLFRGRPPLELTRGSFRELIGRAKYRAHLNYFYGVTVEEALILAAQDELRKRRWTQGYGEEADLLDEAFRNIYGESRTQLLEAFRKERGYPQRRSIDLGELKEFTYWLFKYRAERLDRARVASDTKKGLDYLRRHWSDRRSRSLVHGL
ncbi:MAG: hypothetical protein ACE5IA_01175 [Dehalococcoidia bacterium]